MMPEMERIETLHEIRAKRPDTRIVAISGAGSAGTFDFVRMARELGADLTLSKPIELGDILEAVCKLAATSDAGPSKGAARSEP